MFETSVEQDRVITLHPALMRKQANTSALRASAEEFDRLVISCDCNLCDSIPMPMRKIHAASLLGSGQVARVADQVHLHEAVVVFVDHPLTPVQQRNLERSWDAKVVDRTGLILEIFAARARTKEGVLQVELASLNYQISRLVRSWTHLERQRGGVGFMGGPGERQIELDRRMIRERITSLEQDLAKVQRMRATQRAGRQRKDMPTVALVGYTNAGKSTLFNHLTKAHVHVEDRLFATLDPTLRLLELEGGGQLVLSDTVGFVQDLPHELVDAFRATLEEVIHADLILHVHDAADTQADAHAKVVRDTLMRLGIKGDAAPPMIEVWNKVDMTPQTVSRLLPEISGSRVALSALTGQGVDTLTQLLEKWLEKSMVERVFRIHASDGKALAYCHAHGRVLAQTVCDSEIKLRVRLSKKAAGRLEQQLAVGA